MPLFAELKKRFTRFVREAVVPDTEEGWSAMTASVRHTDTLPAHRRREIIDTMRALYRTNPLAKNQIRFYAAKVFGKGFSVRANDPLIEYELHRALEALGDLRALAESLLVDGELFLSLLRDDATFRTNAEFVCPKEIETIEIENGNPVAYARRIIDEAGIAMEKRYSADSMLHIAINRSPNSPFGLSDLYASAEWLTRYERVVKAAARNVELENSFAWHVKVHGGAKADIEKRAALYNSRSFRENLSKGGGLVISNEKEEWSLIAKDGRKTIDETAIREAKLMAIAGSTLPEFIVTGDAKNANYSSAQAQDMPFVAILTDYQSTWERALRRYFTIVLTRLVERGMLPPVAIAKRIVMREYLESFSTLHAVKAIQNERADAVEVIYETPTAETNILIHFPDIIASDDKTELEVLQMERAMGLVSKKEAAERRGYRYDYETQEEAKEEKNVEE